MRWSLVPAACSLLLCSLWIGTRRGWASKAGIKESGEQLRYPPSKIAIIGAGIGGTSTAFFLRQKFGRDVLIDIFERGEVGGRLATVHLEGQEYEAGGSVIHPLNLHMKNFVKDLGLSVRSSQTKLTGIYNGEEFVFEESEWFIINIIKLIWRYGFSFLRMYMWVEDMMDKFMRIYRYQSFEYSFSTIESLLHALGGNDFTQKLNCTIDETMQKAGFSEKFISEIVTPAMRVNYGQSAKVNGFVGAVSLAGTDSGLWAVEGGNKLVCFGLLYSSKAQLILGTVTSIKEKTRPQRTGGILKMYEVSYQTASGTLSNLYDIIIIATPLNHGMSNIHFLDFSPPIETFQKNYHQTVATFIHGRINASFFGWQDGSDFNLADILTTGNSKLFLNSIGAVSPVKSTNDHTLKPASTSCIWKVFSPESLTEEQLQLLFTSYHSVIERKWLAYPQYNPPEKCPPIILHDRMYYVNAIERAASAMEMSAIAAKNVALLAHHHWYNKLDKIDQEDLNEKLKSEL
ncbi:prenylcysteine oxidase 1 [Microcaecilia unicolor]|uniref:Prenylcysteine oxidase 1 n=1 Tax=Microcaecilia unicolor TaxID=1415580 RepID=A0A6P7XYU8_9AMPH|nr:prenylcysteine oxidase 1 [Microcaecilia unicolor]